jgi:hypothetical protein
MERKARHSAQTGAVDQSSRGLVLSSEWHSTSTRNGRDTIKRNSAGVEKKRATSWTARRHSECMQQRRLLPPRGSRLPPYPTVRAGALGFSDFGQVPAAQVAAHGTAIYGVAFGVRAEQPQVRVGEDIVLTTAFVNYTSSPIWLGLRSVSEYHYSVILHTHDRSIELAADSRKGAYTERFEARKAHILPDTASLEPLVLTDMFTVPQAGILDVTVTVDTFPTMGSALPRFSLESNAVQIHVLPYSVGPSSPGRRTMSGVSADCAVLSASATRKSRMAGHS